MEIKFLKIIKKIWHSRILHWKGWKDRKRFYWGRKKTGENRIILFTGANDKVDKDKIDLFLNNYEEKIDICLLQNEIPPPESVEYSILRLNKKKESKSFMIPLR